MKWIPTLLAAFALGTSALPASAQEPYPSRPVKIIVAYSAGTGSDTLARILAEEIAKPLGVPISIENREGAGGNIGHAAAAKSRGDGYTLLLGASTMAMGVHAVSPPPYDPVKDFTPIAAIAELPMVVAVSTQAPFKTWAEFVAYAKGRRERINYVTTGKGGSSHLFTTLLMRQFGFEGQDVVYKNVGQAVTDLASNRADIFVANLPPVRGLLQNGQLRLLAVGSLKRLPEFPDVPTFAELTGKPDFQIALWYGVLGPAGVPPPVVARLRTEVEKAAQVPAVRAKIEAAGFSLAPAGSAEFAEMIRTDNLRFAAQLKELGLAAGN